MGVRIGLVGQRADLAVEVAALAARAGASVVSLGPDEVSHAVGGQMQVDLVLVDVAVVGAGALGDPGGLGVPAWADRIGGDPAPGEQGWGSRTPTPLEGRIRAGCLSSSCAAPGEGQWAREAAVAVGCAHVVELPLGAPWLVSQLAPDRGSAVLGIVGAVGGVGATTIAIGCAVGAGPDCLLVDADRDSPGLDLPLGIPEGAGVRWSEIPDTSDPLDAGSLRSALPQVGRALRWSPARGSAPDWHPGAGRHLPGVGAGRWRPGRRARGVHPHGGGCRARSTAGGRARSEVIPWSWCCRQRSPVSSPGGERSTVWRPGRSWSCCGRPGGCPPRRGRAAGGPGGLRGPSAATCRRARRLR